MKFKSEDKCSTKNKMNANDGVCTFRLPKWHTHTPPCVYFSAVWLLFYHHLRYNIERIKQQQKV